MQEASEPLPRLLVVDALSALVAPVLGGRGNTRGEAQTWQHRQLWRVILGISRFCGCDAAGDLNACC